MNLKAVTVVSLACAVLAIPVTAWAAYPETREYLLGDIDGISYAGPNTVDDVYADPNMVAYLQTVAPSEDNDDFDVLGQNNNVPFTFLFPLGPNETVTAASLEVGLRGTNSLVTNDWLVPHGDDVTVQYVYTYSDLSWLPIADTGVTVRTVDLSNIDGDDRLALLQDGKLDFHITDDTAVDYAKLTIEVTPEPATLVLLALGGLSLLHRRRVRQ